MTRDPSLYVKNEETGLFFIREGVKIDADTKLAETIWMSKTADQTMRFDQRWFADRFGCKAIVDKEVKEKRKLYPRTTLLVAQALAEGKPVAEGSQAASTHGLFAEDERSGTIWLQKQPFWELHRDVSEVKQFPRPLVDVDFTGFRVWAEKCFDLSFSKELAVDAIQAAAREHRFDKVREYLDGLRGKWDGLPRLETWAVDYLKADDDVYTRAVSKRWLISAVARTYQPGCQADAMLVLEGEQGVGKTTTLHTLFGAVESGHTDRFPNNLKDQTKSAHQIQGYWCVECSELGALRHAEVEDVKSFITARTDLFRKPYGRVFETFPRRAVLAGTVNPDGGGYIKDSTGARRFWPVRSNLAAGEVGDLPGLLRAREQIWAEAVWYYDNSEAWHLTREESTLQAAEAECRQVEDPWAEPVGRWAATHEEFTTLEVLVGALSVENKHAKSWEAQRVAAVLRRHGYTQKRQQNRRSWSK